ncbi:unnamed protein product [Rhodiola kirilowii]
MESKVPRKVQKADREKLRRDRLNEHFLELGNTIDAERPKNDKGTILTDTIQELKDLTTEVSRLKAEYAALFEESRELAQEKHELREEKVSLKAEIDNLNLQYQQRVRVMFPWTSMDPSVVLTSPYPYPYPLPVRPSPIAMHPTLQPFPFFANQNPGIASTPSSTYMPYPPAPATRMEQVSVHYASGSQNSSQRNPKRKSSEYQNGNRFRESDVSNDVATELELKMPGSSTQQVMSEEKKGKQPQSMEDSVAVGSSSSRCSSFQELQDNSSNSLSDTPKLNK